MAIVFTEGFDNYGSTSGTNLATRWTSVNSGTVTSAVTPYGVGQALSVNSSSLSTDISIGSLSSFTIGFAFRTTSLASGIAGTVSRDWILTATSNDTYMIALQLNNNGSLQVNRQTGWNTGTSLGFTSPGVITINTWYYIELSVLISDTVGTVRLDVNGQTLLNLSNQDTRNGTPTTFNTIRLSSCLANITTYYDDMYLTDNTTPLGPQRIETLRPNADTAQKQWTASTGTDNFAMIDESPMNTTDYVYTSTLNNYDLYDFNNLSATPSSISSVTAYALAQKDNVGTRAIAVPVKSGSTTNDGANVYLASGWTLSNRILETDPNTSSAWTASAVNSIQAGLKVTI